MNLSRALFSCSAAAFLLVANLTAADAKFVSLNVVASDSHGQPVADLTAADLQVTDNAKPQEIAYFHLLPTKLQPLAAPAGREATNRTGGVYPHNTVILLDLLNSAMTDRGFSPAEISRNLQGLETADSLYFYLLTKDAKLYPVRGLPENPAGVKPESTPWTKKIRSLLDDALQKVNKLRPGDRLIDTQVKQTYLALDTVVAALAAMPGRSSVIWISHGVPMAVRLPSGDGEVRYTAELKRLAVTCERAGAAIYTVDPSGDTPNSQNGMAQMETMEAVATYTGGSAWRGDDVAAATRLAMGDTRANYRIAYALPADAWDGKLHKLKVTSSRKGVTLLARQNFYADLPAAGEPDKFAMQTGVNSAFDDPDIDLRVSTGAGKAAQSTRFRLLVDPADILLVHDGDHYSGQLDIAFLQSTAEGPKSVSNPAVNSVSLTQAQYESAVKTGIPIDQELVVGPDIRKVKVIVYDRQSGLSGTVTVPVGGQ